MATLRDFLGATYVTSSGKRAKYTTYDIARMTGVTESDVRQTFRAREGRSQSLQFARVDTALEQSGYLPGMRPPAEHELGYSAKSIREGDRRVVITQGGPIRRVGWHLGDYHGGKRATRGYKPNAPLIPVWPEELRSLLDKVPSFPGADMVVVISGLVLASDIPPTAPGESPTFRITSEGAEIPDELENAGAGAVRAMINVRVLKSDTRAAFDIAQAIYERDITAARAIRRGGDETGAHAAEYQARADMSAQWATRLTGIRWQLVLDVEVSPAKQYIAGKG